MMCAVLEGVAELSTTYVFCRTASMDKSLISFFDVSSAVYLYCSELFNARFPSVHNSVPFQPISIESHFKGEYQSLNRRSQAICSRA